METKPGLATTEFWVTAFTNVLAVLDLAGVWDYVPDKWATIALAIVNAAYAVSRGQAKSGVAFDDTTHTVALVPKKRSRTHR